MGNGEWTAVVTVNYNAGAHTIECLNSLLCIDDSPWIAFVVDNASPDGSSSTIKNWLRSTVPGAWHSAESRVKMPDIDNHSFVFLQSQRNLGFAAGNNVALRLALQSQKVSYFWLLNNDTTVEKLSLSFLTAALRGSADVGVCGSRIMDYWTKDRVSSLGGTINRHFGTSAPIRSREGLSNLDYVEGMSMCIGRRCLETVGLLSEDYFLYYEDSDYCFRARRAGFRVACAYDSVVYHKRGGAFAGKRNTNVNTAFTDILQVRNRIVFARRHLKPRILFWLGFLYSLVLRLWRAQPMRVVETLRVSFRYDAFWRFVSARADGQQPSQAPV